jgi:hypothetical protein
MRERRGRNVVIEFPSYHAALACWRSAEYAQAATAISAHLDTGDASKGEHHARATFRRSPLQSRHSAFGQIRTCPLCAHGRRDRRRIHLLPTYRRTAVAKKINARSTRNRLKPVQEALRVGKYYLKLFLRCRRPILSPHGKEKLGAP